MADPSVRWLIGCAASLICAAVCAGVSPERLEWFKDQKLALMTHFGLYSQPGIIESWPLSDRDAHWSRVEWGLRVRYAEQNSAELNE